MVERIGKAITLAVMGLATAGMLWSGVRTLVHPALAESSLLVPAPKLDEKAPVTQKQAKQEVAVLAGGCFWGVQGVFQHVKGVTSAVSGYSGGEASTAQYETVSTGATGHAESVKITFDPSQVSYGEILRIYFSVVADPTTLNYQGPDYGTQYRTEIFTSSPEQEKVAAAYIQQLDAAHTFGAPIVTKVAALKGFYPAEAYHQDFLALNPSYPYIAYNDIPKVQGLKRLFPNDWRDQPVLVNARKS
jgi:peptide-methionine (S)-S-oxide reductase